MEQLDRVYAAFNARDLETALALMHPDVDWPNGWEGGRVHGRDAVRAYWTRQFAAIDSRVHPRRYEHRADGRIAVTVHQVVRGPGGETLDDRTVEHVYTFAGGLVTRMDINEEP